MSTPGRSRTSRRSRWTPFSPYQAESLSSRFPPIPAFRTGRPVRAASASDQRRRAGGAPWMQRSHRRAEPVRDRVAEERDCVRAAGVDLHGRQEVPGLGGRVEALAAPVRRQVALTPVAGRERLRVEGRGPGSGVEVQGHGHRLPGGHGERDVIADQLAAQRVPQPGRLHGRAPTGQPDRQPLRGAGNRAPQDNSGRVLSTRTQAPHLGQAPRWWHAVVRPRERAAQGTARHAGDVAAAGRSPGDGHGAHADRARAEVSPARRADTLAA